MVKSGLIVKATAGKEKNRYFVVVGYDRYGRCLIADGKRRKLSSPKAKKLKHIVQTQRILPQEEYSTDKKLRKSINNFVCSCEGGS